MFICYHSIEDLYLPALKKIQDKKKASHSISVEEFSDHKECHVVFSQGNEEQLKTLISSIEGKDILSISNVEGFAQMQGMIELTRSGKKLRFTVNKTTVDLSGLKVSSKLMRLAKVIE